MKIKNAVFLKSSDGLKNCPELNVNEVALLGRSNVGKSSFINKICNRKNLAKTSNTPGKTRLMNYFLIDEKFAIVDLPGYGFAKVSQTEQEKWRKELENYLLNRKNLVAVIQFIDGRHDVQKNDLQMREWIKYHNLKVYTIVTKMDYVNKSQTLKVLNNIEKIDFKYAFVRKSMQKTVSRELKRSLREQLYICFSMALAVRYNVKLFSKYFGNKTNLLRRATLIQKSNMFDNNLVEFPMLNYYKSNNKGKTSYSGMTFEECINRYCDADLDEFSIKYAPRFIHFQEYCISQNILKIDCVSDESFLDDVLLGYRAILKRFSSYSNELSLRINTSKPKTTIILCLILRQDRPKVMQRTLLHRFILL